MDIINTWIFNLKNQSGKELYQDNYGINFGDETCTDTSQSDDDLPSLKVPRIDNSTPQSEEVRRLSHHVKCFILHLLRSI